MRKAQQTRGPKGGHQITRTRNNRVYKPMARSRVTNGRDLIAGVDQRLGWVRRFRDVLMLHLSDLGGLDHASHAEQALARRATCITIELEQMERQFALADGSTPQQLDTYCRTANTLRRIVQTLGLKRRQKDVTGSLDQYIQRNYGQRQSNDDVEVIMEEEDTG